MKTLLIKNKRYGDTLTFVDDEDYEYLNQWKWYLQVTDGKQYIIRSVPARENNGIRTSKSMHIEIINRHFNLEYEVIDHKDGNGLNNQKCNLRPCSQGGNVKNRCSAKSSTSKYLGVGWDSYNKSWKAQIRIKGKSTHLGSFQDEIDAAKAYDEAAKLYHGEFANLNFK